MSQGRFFNLDRADEIASKADEWVSKNWAVWGWMKLKAAEAARDGRHFSIARLVEEARYTKPVQGIDEYRINNDIRAPLARRLKKEVPICAEYIEIRESMVDL